MLATYMLYGNQMIEELQNKIYEEQRKHRDELLDLTIELVCKRSDLKYARYEIEGLKRQIDILKDSMQLGYRQRYDQANAGWRC